MTTKPDALTRAEFASLRELAKGSFAAAILRQHILKLSNLGLIVKVRVANVRDEHRLTEAGKTRLAEGPPAR